MLSFIKFRMPALHDNFFESLWMWDFQLRFSSRVTPRNLASLTCFIKNKTKINKTKIIIYSMAIQNCLLY